MHRVGKHPTFDESRHAIWRALHAAGWRMSDSSLKIPHATSPDGGLRLWFKGQAVHATEGNNHTFGNARNFFGYGHDIRDESPESFLVRVDAERSR